MESTADNNVSPPSVPPPALSAVLSSSGSLLNGCVASVSQSPQLPSLDNGAHVCVTCGRGGGGLTLHRLKRDSSVRHHCSSCILFYNKGMYCSQCFQVYCDASQVGDPSLWLTCCKCQRLSHLECVRNLGSSAGSLDCSLFICKDCCNPSRCREVRGSNVMNGASTVEGRHLPCMASAGTLSPSDKALRRNGPLEGMPESSVGVTTGLGEVAVHMSSGPAQEASRSSQNSPVLGQEALTAANIVAALAANEAKDAKAKARVLAVAAVKAAARAKAALDAAYRAGRDEAKWRVEALRNIAAVGAPHSAQLVVMPHSTGGIPLEKGQLETAAGVEYQPLQLGLVRSDEEEPATHMSAVPNHRKRALSSIAPSEPMQGPLRSCGDIPQGGAPFKQQQQLRSQIGTEVREFRPISSAYEISYILRDESSAASLVGPEGLAASGSTSMLDGAGSTHVDTVCSLPEMRTVAESLCSSFLPGNGVLGTQISVSVNDSVAFHRGDLATGGSDPLPRQSLGSSMADAPGVVGRMTNQASDKEVKTFPHCTREASPNDLANLGTSSPWRGNEEARLSNGFVTEEQASAPHGFSIDSACVGEERREKMTDSVVLSKSEKKARSGLVNHQLGPPEQPNGTKLAAGQGKQVSDESLLLANKAFMQKNQRSVVLHMSASNHGEQPVPYGIAKGSVSAACSVPLQTTALTSVPTGPHS